MSRHQLGAFNAFCILFKLFSSILAMLQSQNCHAIYFDTGKSQREQNRATRHGEPYHGLQERKKRIYFSIINAHLYEMSQMQQLSATY